MRLVDADALKEAMGEEPYVWTDSADEIAERNQWLTDMHIIESAPTIEAVRKGKWEEHPFDEDWDICSVCGFGTKRREHGNEDGRDWVVQYVYDFCPRCGARLEEA